MNRRHRIDLARHMAECDANYLRMLKLAPANLEPGSERRFSLPQPAGGVLSVSLRVTEKHRYTSTVDVDIRREGAPAVRNDAERFDFAAFLPPSMTVRLYHDARSAEVQEIAGYRGLNGWYEYPNAAMHQPDERAQQNRFLSEFLDYSLDHGAAEAVRDAGAAGATADEPDPAALPEWLQLAVRRRLADRGR